jgi:hypothetical protein
VLGVPVYARAADLYAVLGPVLDSLRAQRPDALAGLLVSKLRVCFKCVQPAGEIWLDASGRALQVAFGPRPGVRADMELSLSADTLHGLLARELSLKKAMGGGLIRVRGPAWRLPVLVKLIQAGRDYYPAAHRAPP